VLEVNEGDMVSRDDRRTLTSARHSGMTLVLIILVCGLARAQDYDVIKIDTSLVTLNVSVTDHKHRHLTGLKAEDFQVTDQGRLVRPEFFDSQGPVSIVFVVDVSSSMKYKWKNLSDGLKKFLAKGREGNDYGLIAFNEKPWLVASSVNAEQLWQAFNTLKPSGETALYDALLLGLDALERVPHRHRALILLSDGEDNCSHAGLVSVQQETLAHRATIYPVGILIDERLSPYHANGKTLLTELAASTGGFVLFPAPDQIREVLELVSADLSNQYSLSYYPPEKAPGWRSVQVNLPRNLGNLNIRYQQHYLMR
jgi:VWFA-related protein